MEPVFGGVEAGGTKFICAVGNGPENLLAEARFATTEPANTLAEVEAFFRPYAQDGRLAALGVGSFGPVDLNPQSPHFGCITTTPKPGWAMTDIAGRLQRAFGIPVAFDTDVNAAAAGEQHWSEANRGLDPFLYVTVGTGIGVGIVVNGATLHGLMHAEAGHMLLPHDRAEDPYPGMCPFHGDCWEGLASGPAMARRWGQPAETLPADHPGWTLEARYIARALANLVMTCSPRRIVLGGGVPQHPGLHAAVRAEVVRLLNGYISSPAILEGIDAYIVPPALGSRAGVLGAIALAIRMMEGGG